MNEKLNELMSGIASTKEKAIIETDQIKIYKNSFLYENAALQISNMSMITVAPVAEKKINPWAMIAVIAGFVLLFQSFFLGCILLLGGGLFIASVVLYNSQKGYFLRIHMNSGVNYYFSGKSKEFLEQVKDVMTECMNDRKHSYIIDMGNASIEALQVGDGNTVVRG